MTDSIGTIGSTSSSLLTRIKTRDQEAWQRLVHLYGPLVNFWLRQRTSLQEADASDIFQEVFRTVAEKIGTFRRDRPSDTFRGWLRTITRSKLADHFHRAENQPTGIGGSDANQQLQQVEDYDQNNEDPGEADTLRQLRRRMMESLQGEFEPKTWEMFWRTTVESQAPKDVAADMGVSTAAVRQAKSRVMSRLREEWTGLEEF